MSSLVVILTYHRNFHFCDKRWMAELRSDTILLQQDTILFWICKISQNLNDIRIIDAISLLSNLPYLTLFFQVLDFCQISEQVMKNEMYKPFLKQIWRLVIFRHHYYLLIWSTTLHVFANGKVKGKTKKLWDEFVNGRPLYSIIISMRRFWFTWAFLVWKIENDIYWFCL